MPMSWIEPEVAAQVGELKIFCTYKNNFPRVYWYTTAAWQDDIEGDYQGEDYRFDIRDVVPDEVRQRPIKEQLEFIIRNKLVKFPKKDAVKVYVVCI